MGGLQLDVLKPESVSWETAIRLFLLRCRSQNFSDRTQGLYAAQLRPFLGWVTAGAIRSPGETSATHLRTYLGTIRARGVSSATLDGHYRLLRTLFNFLLKDGLLLIDPMAQVERPQRERRFVKPMTEDQLKALLGAIDTRDVLGLRDYALILFLADTGLRLSEALDVKISVLDWVGGSVVVLGKGRKERRVAFGLTARKALQIWVQRRGPIDGSDWLWVNRHGEQMRPNNFEQRMKKHTKGAGIAGRRVSPHALRHFFALQFLKNGGDAMSLQKLLGHSSLDMVRNYVNMTDDEALARHRTASPLDRMGPLPNQRKRVVLR